MQGCPFVGDRTCPYVFDIDGTIIVGQVFEVVEFDKIRREVAEFHVHVFRSGHGGVEVEIFRSMVQ